MKKFLKKIWPFVRSMLLIALGAGGSQVLPIDQIGTLTGAM